MEEEEGVGLRCMPGRGPPEQRTGRRFWNALQAGQACAKPSESGHVVLVLVLVLVTW